jgi:broad specificity phosphatase PhoE
MPPAWLSAASPPPTVTLLLRHGQTQMSVEKRYAGTSDVPLTMIGLDQAAAAAKRLAGAGLDAIVSSPLLRARGTASEVAALCGLPVIVDEGFRETDFGAWEGLTFAEVRERWPDEVAEWLAHPEEGPPGGESFVAARERVEAALARVLAAYAGRKVLIVSHVGPVKTLVASALLAPPAALFRMHLDLAALSAVDWYAGGSAVLRFYNDTAHLNQLLPGQQPG